MKVVYLTWGETPRSYGVFGSQVIGQFVETARLCSGGEFNFISAVPLIHSGFVREKMAYIAELKLVRKMLGCIPFHWIPIYTTQNCVYSDRKTFRTMHGLSHVHLLKKLRSIEPDIVHCRSYHAAWAALEVRRSYGLKYKILFDGRGLWPEEVSLKKGWVESSKDYSYLKEVELSLLSQCDMSVSVSDTMHAHYERLGAKNDKVIYLGADTSRLSVDIVERTAGQPVRFCYVGALSEDTWHQPKALYELYARLRKLFGQTRLTIVTTSDHARIQEEFNAFPDGEIIVTSVREQAELKRIFQDQDFGLMAYFIPACAKQAALGKMVLAVKTVEYLAAGLPVICNEYCGGAAEIINKRQLGISYNPHDFKQIKLDDFQKLFDVEFRKKCRDFAVNNFDYKVNAVKYLNAYRELRG